MSATTGSDPSPAEPRLRRLRPADAGAHRALMLEAYATVPEAFTSSVAEREALPLSWWAARMADAPQADELVCGAFVGDRLVAAGGLSVERRERTRHKATLFGLYVQPAARGQGLARALVLELLRVARERPGLELVQLTVSDGNAAALSLYLGCGFAVFGHEPRAVRLGERRIDKLHLWCPLHKAIDAAPADAARHAPV